VILPLFCHPISAGPVDCGEAVGHDVGMESNQVTRRQARTIKARLQPTLDYVARLAARMRARGFPPDAQLMKLVGNAERALHELQIDLLIRTLEGPTAPPAEPPMHCKSKRALEIRDRQQRIR
jgi:hypothetical protein